MLFITGICGYRAPARAWRWSFVLISPQAIAVFAANQIGWSEPDPLTPATGFCFLFGTFVLTIVSALLGARMRIEVDKRERTKTRPPSAPDP